MTRDARNELYRRIAVIVGRGIPGKKERPRLCRMCEYSRPDWPYRSCCYVECPFKRKKYTIRSNPLYPEPEGLVMAGA